MEIMDQMQIVKEQMDRQETSHINSILEKDDKILKLKSEIRELDKKFSDIQGVFDSNRMTPKRKHSNNISKAGA